MMGCPHISIEAILTALREKYGVNIYYERVNFSNIGLNPVFSEKEMYVLVDRKYETENLTSIPIMTAQGKRIIRVSSVQPKHSITPVCPPIEFKIKNTETGEEYVLAQQVNNILFFQINPMYLTLTENVNLETFMEELVSPVLDTAISSLTAFIEHHRLEETRRKITEVLKKSRKSSLSEAEKNLSTFTSAITQKENELSGLYKREQEARDKVKSLEYYLNSLNMDEALTLQFNIISSLIGKQLKSVDIDQDGSVKILTKPLFIQHHGREYGMGSYRIRLMDKSSGSEVFFYKDDNFADCPTGSEGKSAIHPHVHPDGHACFGSAGSLVGKLMSEQRYGDTIVWLLNFLTSYNPDSPVGGGEISHWWPNYNKYRDCRATAGSAKCVACEDTECAWTRMDIYQHCFKHERMGKRADYCAEKCPAQDCPFGKKTKDMCFASARQDMSDHRGRIKLRCMDCSATKCEHYHEYETCHKLADQGNLCGNCSMECQYAGKAKAKTAVKPVEKVVEGT